MQLTWTLYFVAEPSTPQVAGMENLAVATDELPKAKIGLGQCSAHRKLSIILWVRMSCCHPGIWQIIGIIRPIVSCNAVLLTCMTCRDLCITVCCQVMRIFYNVRGFMSMSHLNRPRVCFNVYDQHMYVRSVLRQFHGSVRSGMAEHLPRFKRNLQSYLPCVRCSGCL